MNSIILDTQSFSPYARSKITWTIENFCPELLRNNGFYSEDSPHFSINLSSGFKNVTKWKLTIHKNRTSLSVYLNKLDLTDYRGFKNYDNLTVHYDVGLLHIDQTVSHKTEGKFSRIWYSEKMGRLINYKELVSKKWSLIDNKCLTIVVRLDLVENFKLPPNLNAMSKQYEKLFNNVNFSDFTLITSEGKEIPVHKNILSIRSPVFETMIGTKMIESKESKATIDDISDRALTEFLRFVYCGRVEVIDEVAAELLYAATKYDVPDLKPLCVRSMTANLSSSNVIETMMLADLHGERELKIFCIDYVKWNYKVLKSSEGWKSVPQGLYKDILDKILPVSEDNSIIKVTSKVICRFAAPLNATVTANMAPNAQA